MKNVSKILILIPVLLSFTVCYSNDGSFRASGNQLIPMYETVISVKKEILTIKKINPRQAAITVYYEFFNPKQDKELEVGFEAFSPYGDVEAHPVNGQHPYIRNFTVNLNGESIPFKVAIVSDSLYYSNGKYKSKTVAQVLKENEDVDNVNFFYVYHFRALFKQGINVLQHTYVVDLSSSVEENYSLPYVLTAARRWANRQIDDFTLQIDMGDLQDISIQNTFFSHASEWQLSGGGKSTELIQDKQYHDAVDISEFFIRKGTLVFQKRNFKPSGELYMYSHSSYFFHSNEDMIDGRFDCKRDQLPFAVENQDALGTPVNELSKKILRNLPFARRGYVFKSIELQSYFERQPWYIKDETYQPVADQLTPKEQAWLNKL